MFFEDEWAGVTSGTGNAVGGQAYTGRVKDSRPPLDSYKVYATDPGIPAGRYSPGHVVSCKSHVISGEPDRKHISTRGCWKRTNRR